MFYKYVAKAASLFCLFISLAAKDRPNILWIVSEDNGARWLGCYGNPVLPTPTLDKLAREGFRYTKCFASVGVCAPQRFTWITGINAVSAGTQNMRSSIKIPDSIRFYPELLRELGYYVSKGNDAKTDYNMESKRADEMWNDPSNLKWNKLKANQPFFHVINSHLTHESRTFGDYNMNENIPPDALNLASYHPNIPEMRYVYDKYNTCLKKMDSAVATWLKELEQNDLSDDTIVIYSSDHAGVLPRSKRFLYNSGTHCPLIIRIPEAYKKYYPKQKIGTTIDALVSFVDFPKTWLSVAGARPDLLAQMQGINFFDKDQILNQRYVYSFRQRMDNRYDMARSVRDSKWLYIKNYMPFVPNSQVVAYTQRQSSLRAWQAYHKKGKTNNLNGRFFKKTRDINELYEYNNDYDNVINLANNSLLHPKLLELQEALRKWQLTIYDSGFVPEDDMNRLVTEHNMTVYDFVRDADLYPLEKYINIADLSLENDPQNVGEFKVGLFDEYLGTRYWSTLGILNLTFTDGIVINDAIKSTLLCKLNDDSESEVILSYVAWALIRLGERKAGFNFLKKMVDKTYSPRTILNILDWMEEPEATSLITYNYLRASDHGSKTLNTMLPKLLSRAPPDLVELIQKHEKLKAELRALKKYSQSSSSVATSSNKVAVSIELKIAEIREKIMHELINFG
ncbi:MAG: sulfatase [Puniceicoccaceae bacterium]|nr:sulfatase [Puniceicoccaceae bacterium]